VGLRPPALLAGLVTKVTLHFDHPQPLKRGWRTTHEHTDVEFTPGVAQLLGTGRNSPS
jgi:hypothetical protein